MESSWMFQQNTTQKWNHLLAAHHVVNGISKRALELWSDSANILHRRYTGQSTLDNKSWLPSFQATLVGKLQLIVPKCERLVTRSVSSKKMSDDHPPRLIMSLAWRKPQMSTFSRPIKDLCHWVDRVRVQNMTRTCVLSLLRSCMISPYRRTSQASLLTGIKLWYLLSLKILDAGVPNTKIEIVVEGRTSLRINEMLQGVLDKSKIPRIDESIRSENQMRPDLWVSNSKIVVQKNCASW